jgi:phosphatidate cytidylyltransferase
VILLVVKGSYLLFTVLIALVSFIGMMEYCRMILPSKGIAGVIASLAGALLPFLFYTRSAAFTAFVLVFLFLSFAIYTLFSFKDIKYAASEAALLFFGVIYIPYLLGYLVLLRGHPLGFKWILLVMLIVMSGDSAAYFIGCRFGKRKLYAEVSPKKSIEGALGGLAGSLSGAVIAKIFFFAELSVADALLAALLIGTLGQIGDLFESLLKRSCNVKDSGTIFPGHGGILDRLDSILFAAPVAYYYALFAAGRLFN